MARPLKDGLDYFPHDVNASTDKKIDALRTLHGNNAYVFYFVMLEQIYQEPNFELDISDAETREEMIQILAKKVQVTVDEFKQLLDTALRWSCFDKKLFDEKGILTSNGIKKRAEPVLAKRQQMRDRYHSAKERISDAETTPETGSETPQSKEKKSKVKENKIYSPEFETWFSSWPRAQAKADSFKNFERRRKEHGLEFLLRCSQNYLTYMGAIAEKERGPYYSSNNFFGQKAYYLDFTEPKKPPSSKRLASGPPM